MEDLYQWFETTDYKVLKLTKDCDGGNYAGGLKFMLRFMLCYAKARYVFLCDNFLPAASCNKREETTVVQMWHAGGMLKSMHMIRRGIFLRTIRGMFLRITL